MRLPRHLLLPALVLALLLPATPAGAFTFGLNTGNSHAFELGFITPLGARHVRAEFPIRTPASRIAPVLDGYAKAGIKPLLVATFTGRLPTTAEARNLGRWAAAFGPDGTHWRGKGVDPRLTVTQIEFGNETNNPYQYKEDGTSPRWFKQPKFLARAAGYARRAALASTSMKAADPGVGLLVIGEQYGGYTTWVDAMFEAVPDLGDRIAGWTVHPYGPEQGWRQTMDTLIEATRARGAPPLPMYITEWGLTSDGGRCLTDNYGWNRCMTYSRAATTLSTTVARMRARYGSRLAAMYVYSNRDLHRPGQGNDREGFFGALRYDGSSKGPYTQAIRRLLAGSD